MKAIILAAGVGKRFKALTDHRPKCLIQVSGKTLLERTLAALGAAGVREAVIVIGYRGDMIVEEIGERCGAVSVRYIRNPQYEKGAILSLWSARKEFDTDLLIMDADVLFPVRLLNAWCNPRTPAVFYSMRAPKIAAKNKCCSPAPGGC